MVTDIARKDIKYDDGWCEIKNLSTDELKAKLEEYNNSKNRVLYYPWGVFITAYARYNLWSAIFEYKEDYIYCDTDSIKGLNHTKHKAYHDNYNKVVLDKLNDVCKHYNLDVNRLSPKTIKNEIKPLGVWDFEGIYERFKTLGAKRYMYITDKMLSFTISGLNKNYGVPYLADGWACDIKTHKENFNPLDKFNDNMHIPQDYTGKLTHTYVDEEFEIEIPDYRGVRCKIHELSYIHLSKQDFNLSLASSFINYLETFREDGII